MGLRAEACDKVGASGQNARLRAAQQLVAAEGDQVHARAKAVAHQGLVDAEGPQVGQAAAAQVFINGDAALAAERRQFLQRGTRR